MTKRRLNRVLFIAGFCVVAVCGYKMYRKPYRVPAETSNTATQIASSFSSNAIAGFPDLEARRRMDWKERLSWLEKCGEVPLDGDDRDIQLAQNTSWWGKPIDPVKFWKGRVIWNDFDAMNAAQRKGRKYPPMPFQNPNLKHRSTNDIASGSGGVEGPSTRYHWNDRESAFWSEFYETHPIPPGILGMMLFQTANEYIGAGYRITLTKKEANEVKATIKQRLAKTNYPKEVIDDDVLYWIYVMEQREKYQIALKTSPSRAYLSRFIERFPYDARLLTDALSEEQMNKANAWKMAYLNRLRKENCDEQYIQAYLKAWNLSESMVFGKSTEPNAGDKP